MTTTDAHATAIALLTQSSRAKNLTFLEFNFLCYIINPTIKIKKDLKYIIYVKYFKATFSWSGRAIPVKLIVTRLKAIHTILKHFKDAMGKRQYRNCPLTPRVNIFFFTFLARYSNPNKTCYILILNFNHGNLNVQASILGVYTHIILNFMQIIPGASANWFTYDKLQIVRNIVLQKVASALIPANILKCEK